MWLFLLLLVPIAILIFGLVVGQGRVTFKEFLIEFGVMAVLVLAGYFISRYQAISDIEIWNGWVQKAEYYEDWVERVSCRHPIRDKNGNVIGYSHFYDEDYHPPYWQVTTSNEEVVGIDSKYFESIAGRFKNREYHHITRFSKLRGLGNKYIADYRSLFSEFIPTAVEHSFSNYIKADPGSVLRRIGQGEKFDKLLPEYPRIKGYYECDRVIALGSPIADLPGWNKQLAEVNARLGARKWVNITVIVVNTTDSAYVHRLEEHWLGGKINDCVVVIGSTNFPNIDWVRVMSWSRSEDLKVDLRDAILDFKSLEKRDEILSAIEQKVDQKFVHKPIEEFEYLMAGWQPSVGILFFLFLLGIGGSIGLTVYFVKNDPFEDRRSW